MSGPNSPSQELHNYVGRLRLGDLKWEDVDKRIENNRHLWTSIVEINGTTYGKGQGPTKTEARDNAAQQALKALDTL
ncbi:hypothetical protein M378DRAFT_168912 [Amanita muscaria Koide BX008]|uniref:DRBM domain-containing protein n=1 Tax=Amanita muscaria (strain Koide BX008) TaxID=946122 RepID=A0A0C2WTV8_AMAMK|nr:hypothetical protein M378DRAFT_168912 [Amanita muscaria Koide BX008]